MLNNQMQYYFNPTRLLLRRGRAEAWLDGYGCPLAWEPVEGEFSRIQTRELTRLFSPLLTGKEALLTGQDTQTLTLEEVGAVLKAVLGMELTISGDTAVFSLEGEQPNMGLQSAIRRLYWFEEGQRYIPQLLVLPRETNAGTGLILMLHGGGGSPEEPGLVFGGRLADYADKYNSILFCADGFLRNSTYGCGIPPEGIAPEARGMFPDTPEDRQGRALSQRAVMEQLLEVKREFHIRNDRVYLAGNSMGGMGCFHLAKEYPGVFRAIAPAGAAPMISEFPYEKLAGIPIYFTAGRHDHHGWQHLAAAAKHMERLGLQLRFETVEDGGHGDAWVKNADHWFRFLTEAI